MKVRKLVRDLWNQEDVISDESGDGYEGLSSGQKWLFLSGKYTLNPAKWRKEVLDYFEANKRYFHLDEQGSSVSDELVMEAVALLTRSSWEYKDVDVYQECITYYKIFVAFYTNFLNLSDNTTYVPGNRSCGASLVRDANLATLVLGDDALNTMWNFPHGFSISKYGEPKHLSNVMLKKLRRDGHLPRIHVDSNFCPPVKDKINFRKYKDGFIAWCTVLTGVGFPQWLVAINSKTKESFYINWITIKMEHNKALDWGTEGPMNMPVDGTLENTLQKVAQQLKLGEYVSDRCYGSAEREYPKVSVIIPDDATTKKYQDLYKMNPSKFFKANRFSEYIDLNAGDLRDALIVWLIQHASVNEQAKKIADALLAELDS